MITELRIQGFKTLRQLTTIPLSPVTVLVGANNSGKSNILSAIELVGALARRGDFNRTIDELGGWEAISPRSGTTPFLLGFKGEVGGVNFTYSLGMPSQEHPKGTEQLDIGAPINSSTSRAEDGTYALKPPVGDTQLHIELGSLLEFLIRQRGTPTEIRAIYDFLLGIRVFDLSPKALRVPAAIRPNAQLEKDGAGLAAVLDNLAGERPNLRDRVDEEVRQAATEVERVVTRADRKQPGSKVLGIAERSRQVFSAEHVSDGLLLFIALSTAIQMSGGNTLIGLEELEKGIHPRRIRGLVDQLLRMSRGGSQFILTTHSPTLLDEFRDFPERVLICEREGDDTKVTRLVDKPDWEESLKQSSLGEIWYSGILGGVPAR